MGRPTGRRRFGSGRRHPRGPTAYRPAERRLPESPLQSPNRAPLGWRAQVRTRWPKRGEPEPSQGEWQRSFLRRTARLPPRATRKSGDPLGRALPKATGRARWCAAQRRPRRSATAILARAPPSLESSDGAWRRTGRIGTIGSASGGDGASGSDISSTMAIARNRGRCAAGTSVRSVTFETVLSVATFSTERFATRSMLELSHFTTMRNALGAAAPPENASAGRPAISTESERRS